MRCVLSDEIFAAAPSITVLDTMNLTPSSTARARSRFAVSVAAPTAINRCASWNPMSPTAAWPACTTTVNRAVSPNSRSCRSRTSRALARRVRRPRAHSDMRARNRRSARTARLLRRRRSRSALRLQHPRCSRPLRRTAAQGRRHPAADVALRRPCDRPNRQA